MMARPVLLIDDNEAWCREACRLLESHGFRVESVSSGEAALRRLASMDKPLAVLLEPASRGTGGRAFVEAFRRCAAFDDVPLFLVSDAPARDVYLKRLGINGYLRKTVALDYLLFLLSELPGRAAAEPASMPVRLKAARRDAARATHGFAAA